jgi:hypothetical protein
VVGADLKTDFLIAFGDYRKIQAGREDAILVKVRHHCRGAGGIAQHQRHDRCMKRPRRRLIYRGLPATPVNLGFNTGCCPNSLPQNGKIGLMPDFSPFFTTVSQEPRSEGIKIAEYFNHSIVVKLGDMVVIEGGDTAMVISETLLDFVELRSPDGPHTSSEKAQPENGSARSTIHNEPIF